MGLGLTTCFCFLGWNLLRKKSTVFGWKKMAHHRALLASSVMTDYLWMRMITPCIIDPEIPKARRGLTVKGQAICKESSIRFPSGCVVLRWMEQAEKMKLKYQARWCSQTMLTIFCPFLTTYLSPVYILWHFQSPA